MDVGSGAGIPLGNKVFDHVPRHRIHVQLVHVDVGHGSTLLFAVLQPAQAPVDVLELRLMDGLLRE